MNAHIQSVANKFNNKMTKKITNDNTTKKVSFAASEADAAAQVEEAMNKIKVKHGSVCAEILSNTMKEVHSAQQGIKSDIKSNSPNYQKK